MLLEYKKIMTQHSTKVKMLRFNDRSFLNTVSGYTKTDHGVGR